MADFTTIFHRTTYPSISSSNPLNSQSSRTVVIAGASAGIGRGISESFAAAGTSRLILLGRSRPALDAAASELPNAEARVCDISSVDSVKALWAGLKADGVHVDVLVLNAASTAAGTLVTGWEQTAEVFETSVMGNLRMAQAFALINISSSQAHGNPTPAQGSYSASKAAFANLLQHLSEEIPATKVQIINLHPGCILTEAARAVGYTEDSLPWDDVSLPGDASVWAATPAANFLHGRFIWSNWDVDELIQRKGEIVSQDGMLKIGLQGVEFVDMQKTFGRIAEKTPTK